MGNSYTYVNNLPQIVADMAKATGDTLEFESNAIGGYTLNNHSTNALSTAKIKQGKWDYVVLQEQSQLPSFSDAQVEEEVFPYAKILDSLVHLYNPCAETVFYMTWGRKQGDASNCAFWPPVCTYEGMDSLLNLRYRKMAEDNKALVSPVGEVWKYIRKNNPGIELYQQDESHPSVAGSYLAAACFYTTFFRKNPAEVSYNYNLTVTDAETLRAAVKKEVYDNLLKWHIGEYDPVAQFNYTINVNTVTISNNSKNTTNWKWDFGDGDTSTQKNPVHSYKQNGNYLLKLMTDKCGRYDTFAKEITIKDLLGLHKISNLSLLKLYPNPAQKSITLQLSNEITTNNYVLCDQTGRAVMSGWLQNSKTTLDISTLPPGIYFITIGEEKTIQGRIVLSP